jgi:hypothetical protein
MTLGDFHVVLLFDGKTHVFGILARIFYFFICFLLPYLISLLFIFDQVRVGIVVFLYLYKLARPLLVYFLGAVQHCVLHA